MFFLVLFLTMSGDLFVGSGISWGTSLTNTEKKHSVVIGAQIYPLPYKKIGLFYDFQFSNYNFPVMAPFSVKEKKRGHSAGPVFRFSTGRVQPWLGAGLLFHFESTEIKLFDEVLIGNKYTRYIPLATAGTRVRVWKDLYQEVGVNLVGTSRPPWQIAVKTVWRF